MEKLEKVTDAWVEKHYNIEDERKKIVVVQSSENIVGVLENYLELSSTPEQFLKVLTEKLKDYDSVSISTDYYSNDCLELIKHGTVFENKKQVVIRLKEEERARRLIEKREIEELAEYERLKAKFEIINDFSNECETCRVGKNFTGFCTEIHPKVKSCKQKVNND